MSEEQENKQQPAEEKPVEPAGQTPGEAKIEPAATPAPAPEPTPKVRIFVIDGREFDDPDPKMTVDEVRQYYVTYFPELANADTTSTERDSKKNPGTKEAVHEFKKRVGTKGKVEVSSRSPQAIVARWFKEKSLRNMLNAFQENIDYGIPCQMVFDGKAVHLSNLIGQETMPAVEVWRSVRVHALKR